MTDFFVLPGTRVPLGDSGDFDKTPLPGRSVPQDNPEIGDGGVVQVVDAEWARRAALAAELAEELARAQSSLRIVGQKNHYGMGAEEGTEFHARVSEFVNQLTVKLLNHRTALESLGLMCSNANAELKSADEANSHDFEA